MHGAFTSVGSAYPSRVWIALVITTFCLNVACQASEACPPGATSSGVRISVAAYRPDGTTPIGSGCVTRGETIVLRACIFYVPVEPLTGATLSSFEHGKVTITFNGISTDVTPEGGIPLFGQHCDGLTLFHSSNVVHTISEADVVAGAILVRADYADGVAYLAVPVPTRATAQALVRVARQEGPAGETRLAIQKTEMGNAMLSFTGQLQKTYRVEGTSDFVHWSSLGSVVPDSTGRCHFEDSEAHGQAYRFYRYVMVN